MGDAYREMPDVLGENEREEEAIRKLGRWRERTRAKVVLVFALLGLVPAAVAYWLVQELQFELIEAAFVYLNAGAAALVWAVSFAVGAFVGKRVLRQRGPAKIAELAAAYEVPAERLTQTMELVENL